MFTWVLSIAVGSIVLAFLLYFLVPARSVKVPAVVLGTVGGLAAGAVLGLLAAVIYGESVQKAVYADVYRAAPMPKTAPKGPGGTSPPPAAPAPAAKTKGGGGPGSSNMPPDYPGMAPSKKGAEGGPPSGK